MEVLKKVKEVICDVCGIKEDLIKDRDLLENIGIDSLHIVEIIMRFEDDFNIDINVDDILLSHNITVKSLENIIIENIKKTE